MKVSRTLRLWIPAPNYFNSQSDQSGQLQSLSTKTPKMLSYLRASLSSLLKSDGHGGTRSTMSAPNSAHRSNRSTDKCLVHHGSSTWLKHASTQVHPTDLAPTLDTDQFPPLPTTAQAKNKDNFHDALEELEDATTESESSFIPVTTLRKYSPVRRTGSPDHPSKTSTVAHSSCFAAYASYLDEDDEEEDGSEQPIPTPHEADASKPVVHQDAEARTPEKEETASNQCSKV